MPEFCSIDIAPEDVLSRFVVELCMPDLQDLHLIDYICRKYALVMYTLLTFVEEQIFVLLNPIDTVNSNKFYVPVPHSMVVHTYALSVKAFINWSSGCRYVRMSVLRFKLL